jgi:hypothetical protein
MLVKKKNPNWFPSENKQLKVGETIEITDPKFLIINGDVDGIDENGVVVSAYELYGVVVNDEMEEFQEYIAMRKQQALKTQLEAEKKELEKLATSKGEASIEGEEEKPEVYVAKKDRKEETKGK